MTDVLTGLNTVNQACTCAVNGRIYIANDFDPIKVVTPDNGYSAGITGPTGALGAATASAGNTSNGTHLIRYRYRDSKTGYISNPSDNLSVTVSGGNGSLLFNVTSDYTASTDTKVDYIDFEMTPVNDSTFYLAKSILNTASTATVSMSDATLTQQFNSSAIYGSAENFNLFNHEVPPVGSIMVSHRGRTFIGGTEPYLITASFTNGSATVNYSGGSQAWVSRLIQASGDLPSYELLTVASTTMTMTAVYAGTTGSKSCTVYKKLPNRIFYSELNQPESFNQAQNARDVLAGRGDRIKAIYSMTDALYLFGKYSSERLAFNTNPSAVTSNLLRIQGNRGVFNQRCLIEAEGRLFAFDKLGMYEVAETPKDISNHIYDTLQDYVDYSESSQFHGVFDPIERSLIWFFVAAGDSVPKFAAVVDFDTLENSQSARWQFYQYRQGITSSCLVASSDGEVRAWVGDENGYTWALSTTNTFDGIYPTNPCVLSVAAGATTTVIPVDELLYTTVTMEGAIAYFPGTGEECLISTNAASSVTLATALALAPSDGDAMWVGSFPVEYRTKWWAGEGMQNKKKPSYFYLMLYPGQAAGKISIYFFKDFSTQPFTFTPDISYIENDAVSFVNGVLTVDLDGAGGSGFIAINMPSEWSRTLQARIISTKPVGTLRVLDMGFKTGKAEEELVNNE
jgi:hypothetical protein